MTFTKEKELLLKFYQMLPQDLLKKAIENVQFKNRTEKRKYDKYKTLKEKIKAYLDQMLLRVQLAENLYDLIRDEVKLNESEEYETILNLFNAENCVNLTIYMLYRCCDDKFDEKYFSQFLKSEQFEKTLNGNWEEKETANTNEEKHEEEQNCMRKYYLGHIEKRNTFYNFEPQYVYENNEIIELSETEIEEKFPSNGKINLSYKFNGESHEFLKRLNVDDHDNHDGIFKSFYAISFEESDLGENDADYRGFIKKKLEIQDICDSGELKERIKTLNDIGIYKVVTTEVAVEAKDLIGRIVTINQQYDEDECVLLDLGNDYLYGPYPVQIRTVDGERYVKIEIEKSNYLLNRYSFDNMSCESYEFIETPYMRERAYVEFARITGVAEQEDVITDLILLSKIQEDINLDLARTNIEEFGRRCAISPFFKNIPLTFREKRLQRTKKLIEDVLSYQDERKDAVITLIESFKADDVQQLLGTKIFETQSYKDVDSENKKLKAENKQLQEEKEELRKTKESLEKTIKEHDAARKEQDIGIIAERRDDLNQLENDIHKAEDRLAEIQQKYAMYESYEELLHEMELLKIEDAKLQSRIDVHKDDESRYKHQVTELQNKVTGLQDQIKDAVEKKVKEENIANVAFDPYIANVMMDAASKWKSDAETTAYRQIVEQTNGREYSSKTREELVNMLVHGVKAFRKYEKNDIINMYICLAQNFLTIFSGEPGTGKTSMCTIIAYSLGLNTFGQSASGTTNMNRFIPVSVERGWSSKRDLIGYFNPLTKQYDKSNGKIYDGLMVLNEERQESKFPYIMLLDEANLSSMEYYWADFMRVSDRDGEDMWINIGTESDVYIPETLKFLATVNTDQTTEELSPRLIDRAWIIKLPKVELTENQHGLKEYFTDAILWEDIKQTFCYSEKNEVALETVLNDVYKLFERYGLSISPRIKHSIKKYVCVAQELMENETGGANAREKAVDFAILQKLMPKINGYYTHYEKMFETLKTICEENNFTMTKTCIESMHDMSLKNMGYCKYLM